MSANKVTFEQFKRKLGVSNRFSKLDKKDTSSHLVDISLIANSYNCSNRGKFQDIDTSRDSEKKQFTWASARCPFSQQLRSEIFESRESPINRLEGTKNSCFFKSVKENIPVIQANSSLETAKYEAIPQYNSATKCEHKNREEQIKYPMINSNAKASNILVADSKIDNSLDKVSEIFPKHQALWFEDTQAFTLKEELKQLPSRLIKEVKEELRSIKLSFTLQLRKELQKLQNNSSIINDLHYQRKNKQDKMFQYIEDIYKELKLMRLQKLQRSIQSESVSRNQQKEYSPQRNQLKFGKILEVVTEAKQNQINEQTKPKSESCFIPKSNYLQTLQAMKKEQEKTDSKCKKLTGTLLQETSLNCWRIFHQKLQEDQNKSKTKFQSELPQESITSKQLKILHQGNYSILNSIWSNKSKEKEFILPKSFVLLLQSQKKRQLMFLGQKNKQQTCYSIQFNGWLLTHGFQQPLREAIFQKTKGFLLRNTLLIGSQYQIDMQSQVIKVTSNIFEKQSDPSQHQIRENNQILQCKRFEIYELETSQAI